MSYVVEFGWPTDVMEISLFSAALALIIYLAEVIILDYILECNQKFYKKHILSVFILISGIVFGMGRGFEVNWNYFNFKRIPPVECNSMSQTEKLINIYDCDNVKLYVEKGSKVAEKDHYFIITEYYNREKR